MHELATPGDGRESFLDRAEELTPLIAVDTDDGRYLLSTLDRHVTTSLLVKSGRGEMKILRRALAVLAAVGNPVLGRTFVDVGANIGTTTIPALRRHGFTRAVACEPEPRNAYLLELNLVANDLDRDVVICRCAIGDADGEVRFLVAERKSGLHEVYASGSPLPRWTQNPYEATTVRQVTLDTLAGREVFEPEDVGLLWMDAQGHEGHILRGASSLTELGVPVVMELDPGALERHGGLEYVLEIARTCYTHFVSMRQIRGGDQPEFDLDPTAALDREIEWLSGNERFTDVLLLRDPQSHPVAPAPPRRPRPPREPGETTPVSERPALREPDRIPPEEREAFLAEARSFTPLVASRLDGATFIARTAAGADELSLFVERSHPHIDLVERANSALDAVGFGEACRSKAFVQASAGAGIATVVALCSSGFARGLACEPDLGTYRVLKLNMTANALTERVRTLAIALDGGPSEPETDSFNGLLSRGVIDAGDCGLMWITDGDVALTLAASTDALAQRPPLLLRVDQRDAGELVELLARTHTHCVPFGEEGGQAVPLSARALDGYALVLALP